MAGDSEYSVQEHNNLFVVVRAMPDGGVKYHNSMLGWVDDICEAGHFKTREDAEKVAGYCKAGRPWPYAIIT